MSVSRMTAKGQVTITKEFRERLGVHAELAAHFPTKEELDRFLAAQGPAPTGRRK